ncbi:MAG: AI-2E family transporter [Clostridia bacterium]|nr:AI-2E family transporter [Clostridia bacterium]
MKNKFKTFAAAAAGVFLLYLAMFYWPGVSNAIATVFGALLPLAIGAMLAYVLNLMMSFYERHFFPKSRTKAIIKLRRPLCLTGSILTLLAVLAAVVLLVVPQLVSCIQLIVSKIPPAFESAVEYVAGLNILSKETLAYFRNINWEGMIEKVANVLSVGIGGAMNIAIQVVTSVFSGIITAFLSIIFAVYILASKDKIGNQAKRAARQYIAPVWYQRLAYFFKTLNECFRNYIVGQCVEAVILGSLCAVGMLILGLPYAPMVGALVAFTALIPVAGAYIGAGFGAFVILMDSPMKALIFLIFIIVLQQVEGNLIYPKVVGDSVGLPGIWVLAAVTIGGGIMGVLGMLLSVPLAATAYRLVRHDVQKREQAAAEMQPEEPAKEGEEV